MAGHSLAARLTAVICLAMANFHLAVAVVLFDGMWNAREDETVSHVGQFIADSMHRLIMTGGLKDFPRSGRPPKLSDAAVRKCVQQFKRGFTVMEVINPREARVGPVHKYYGSIYHACKDNAYIRRVVARYNISPKHLLRRMHALCPSLKRIRLDYKMELTPENKAARIAAARRMLKLIDDDTPCRTAPHVTFLKRIFWVDEWHIWLTPQDFAQYIWADAFDHHAHTVLPIPKLRRGEKPNVLRCLAVVNAVLGPVHIEFITGTTDLQREVNRHDDANNPYHVSGHLIA